MVSNQEVKIHPSSVIKDPLPECIIFNTIIKTSQDYVRDICAIDESWLIDSSPLNFKENVSFNDKKK
jgi:ATP-dependent RNA helicase DHX8/PRP22